MKSPPDSCLRTRALHGGAAAVVIVLFGLASMYSVHYFSLLAGLDHGPMQNATMPGGWATFIGCVLWVVVLQAYCFNRVLWVPIAVVGVGLLAVLFNIFNDYMSLISYGDAGYLPMVIEEGDRFSRWLLGTAALSDTYPMGKALFGVNAGEWVKMMGALVMAVFTAAIIINSRGRLAYLLPLSTPMWIIFSSGYDEYYPFIAGVYVYFVIMLYQPRLPRSLWIPVLSAVMPLMYIAFSPLGVMLLIRYWMVHPSLWVKSLFLAAFVYLSGLFFLWPNGPIDYASALYLDLNLGEVNTAYGPYQGESSSEYSPFFGISYALSRQHRFEMLYMLSAGMGVVVPVLLMAALVMLFVRLKLSVVMLKLALPRLFFIFIVLWQLYYFVFMIPKLGPFVDIDLFFTFYLVMAILAGAMCDKYLSLLPENSARMVRYYLLAACVGAGLGASYLLLMVGVLPDILGG